MKTLFTKCFMKSPEIPDTPTKTIDMKLAINVIIVLIAILIVIIAVIICVAIKRRIYGVAKLRESQKPLLIV